MPSPDEPTLEMWLREALDLDQDERAYLASLDLASTWRQEATTADARWGLLALLGVVGAFIAWSVASPFARDAFALANLVGLSTFVVTNVVGLLGGLSQTFVGLATAPSLGLSQPFLALVAVVVLLWPRITSAPHFLQGVRP